MSPHLKVVRPPRRSSFRRAMLRSRLSWTRWRQSRVARKQAQMALLLSPLVDRLTVLQLQQNEWQEKLETLLELLVSKHLESSQETRELLMEVLQTLQPSPEEQIAQLLGPLTLPSSSRSSAS